MIGCRTAMQVMAGCWGGRWLQWEEDPDEDTVSEHKQHFSGSAGDVLCLAVTPTGLLAAGECGAGGMRRVKDEE
jgi:hypothetical protein